MPVIGDADEKCWSVRVWEYGRIGVSRLRTFRSREIRAYRNRAAIGVNLVALESRLNMTCFSLRSSAEINNALTWSAMSAVRRSHA